CARRSGLSEGKDRMDINERYQRALVRVGELVGGRLAPYVGQETADWHADRSVEADRRPQPRWPEDVAAIMRGEVRPPEMLIDDWLVKGEMHLFYAEAEAYK